MGFRKGVSETIDYIYSLIGHYRRTPDTKKGYLITSPVGEGVQKSVKKLASEPVIK
jgi:hypothetical protein